jgi:hypothetical protein
VQGIELRPLVLALGAGNAVILIDAYDLPTRPLGNLTELTLLVSGGLVEGRNPAIEDGVNRVSSALGGPGRPANRGNEAIFPGTRRSGL